MTQPDSEEPKFRRRAEARPDEVLDAARELFTRQGYSATSVAQIAKAAGISKGAVYLYFPSKQAILEGLVKRAVLPIGINALQQIATAQQDTRVALSLLLRALAKGLSDPDVFAVPRIVIHEAVTAPEIANFYRDAVLEPAIPALRGLIAEGIARGQIRPVDPDLTVRSVMGPILIHLVLSEVFGIRPAQGLDMPGLVENHLDILFGGLLVRPGDPNDD